LKSRFRGSKALVRWWPSNLRKPSLL
jgi:hypothetical protein